VPQSQNICTELAEYNSMAETDYLLSTPSNVKQLMNAINDVEKGENLIQVDIDE